MTAETPDERAAKFFAETPEPDGSAEEIVAETMREQAERMAGAPVDEWLPPAPTPGTADAALESAVLDVVCDRMCDSASVHGSCVARARRIAEAVTPLMAAREAAAEQRGAEKARAELADRYVEQLRRQETVHDACEGHALCDLVSELTCAAAAAES